MDVEVAFELALRDYDALPEAERTRLKRKAWRVVIDERSGPRATFGATPPTDGDMSMLSDVLSGLLSRATEGVPNEREVTVSLGTIIASDGTIIPNVVGGSFVDRFLVMFLMRAASIGLDRFKRCVCGRPYLKVGRRLGCDDPNCMKQRQETYWQEYKTTPNARRARERFYQKHGWTLGARKKKVKTSKKGARS
jgi:hypothetical protein